MPRLLPLLLLAVLAAALPSSAQAQTAFGDRPGTLRLPEAVAVAPDGTVLVGDHFSGRIQAFRDGRVVPDAAFGMSGAVCGRLSSVAGLARAADGRVYVYDSDNQRVQVFGADGQVQRCWGRRGNGTGEFRTNSGSYAASTAQGGIAVDSRHVYVADTGNNRIQRFTLDGRSPKVLAKGKVKMPQGLAVRDGRLLVADDGNHRVVELDPSSGRVLRASRSGLVSFPYDVAIAPSGQAYVADNNRHRIVVLDRRLRPLRSWGSYGRRPGQLVYPRAVALAPNGNVLVADPGNDRVTEYTARGRHVRTLGFSGRADGSLTAPRDVAVNGRGEAVVADAQRLAWFGIERGSWLGRWAQGRSFQDSTATVLAPESVAFAGDTRVRVGTGGQIRQYGAGEARVIAGERPELGLRTGPVDAEIYARAIVIDAAGVTWGIDRQGRPVSVGADGKPGRTLGEPEPMDRTVTDIAALTDGTIAAVEGGRDNIPNPADGTISRYDPATGRRLSTWTLTRPATAPEPRVPGGEATQASQPSGVVSDGAGGVWVSDRAHGRVVRFDRSGAVVATLGTPGAGPGQLAEPTGLTIACDGSLHVSDTGNNRIVRFPGVAPAAGCGALPSPPTARTAPPKPAGLKVRTRFRATAPARVVARIATSCARTCTVSAIGSASVSAPGLMRQLKLDARVSGRTITLVASPSTVATLRTGLRKPRGYVTAAATISAKTADGVIDVETIVVRFRR